MLSNFHEEVGRVEDKDCKAALEEVCLLFALQTLQDNNNYGLFNSRQMRTIRAASNKVCENLRPNAVALVDAFDYEDNVLNSTIGCYDGNVYERLWEGALKSKLNQTDPYKGWETISKPHAWKGLKAKL